MTIEETTIESVAERIGNLMAKKLSGRYTVKALGHHVEVYSSRHKAFVDLYPRGRYILMRVTGSAEALRVLDSRPAKLPDGTTRYMVVIPGANRIEVPGIQYGRLYVFGYVEYKGNIYGVAAHKSHVELALRTVNYLANSLQDDALFYGMFDTSGRTPTFTLRLLGRPEVNEFLRRNFGVEISGYFEVGGTGTVSAILLAYAHAKQLGRERKKLLRSLILSGNVRTYRRRRRYARGRGAHIFRRSVRPTGREEGPREEALHARGTR